MKAYIMGRYTSGATKGLLAGSDRQAAITPGIEALGGKVLGATFTRGHYDIVVNIEVPSEAVAAGIAMAVQAGGAFSEMLLLTELDRIAVAEAAKTFSATYRPPG